jgi:transposase InsO family protein
MNTLQLQFLVMILREHHDNKRLRFTDSQRRRLARRAKKLSRRALLNLETVVTPETLLRWYRCLIARKYDGGKVRKAGQPKTAVDIEQLVLRMARDNPRWGYTRIRGALRNLGHEIGRNTIKRILSENGLQPVPLRRRGMSWETFLRSQWGAIAAADFFNVEVLTSVGLIRHFVLFVMDLKTRRIKIAGILPQPDGRWMKGVARNLIDAFDGFLDETRNLIHDRDPLFTHDFRMILRASGVRTVKLLAQSPDPNAHAERFVRSIKEECLSHIIPLGERHLRTAVMEYTEHYHRERNHQGIGNRLIEPREAGSGQLERCDRLGGLLKCYNRRAVGWPSEFWHPTGEAMEGTGLHL